VLPFGASAYSLAMASNYPPGAANDSRAPWNQPDLDYECTSCGEPSEFDGVCGACQKDDAMEMRGEEEREQRRTDE